MSQQVSEGHRTGHLKGADYFEVTSSNTVRNVLKSIIPNRLSGYFHGVLEAKLITENRMAISLASGFIKNAEDKFFDS